MTADQQQKPVEEQQTSEALVKLPVADPDPEKIAVVLNANAKRVTKNVLKKIWRLMGKEHVYYSRSIKEAEEFVREIVQKGYGTILCGGGDGTLIHLINMLYQYINESNQWRTLLFERTGETQPLIGYPRIGSLKLGTGNGLSGVLGTTSATSNLAQVLDGQTTSILPIPMIKAENEYFYFAGQGYDAQLLNDYNWVKDNFNNPFVNVLTKGLAGYITAFITRMLPRIFFSGDNVEMKVTTTGEKCFFIDPRRGDRLIPVEQGTVIYEGPLSQIGVATVPFYGYNMRIYPYAGMTNDMMHLRMTDIGAFTAVANIKSLWNGSYRNPNHLRDFLAQKVKIEASRPFPYQHSGEGKGYRDTIEYEISERVVDFIDFYPSEF